MRHQLRHSIEEYQNTLRLVLVYVGHVVVVVLCAVLVDVHLKNVMSTMIQCLLGVMLNGKPIY